MECICEFLSNFLGQLQAAMQSTESLTVPNDFGHLDPLPPTDTFGDSGGLSLSNAQTLFLAALFFFALFAAGGRVRNGGETKPSGGGMPRPPSDEDDAPPVQ
eukprot:GHVU01176165.1.p2 GENE.GHVU01176165.1~~GHVU01176165.1.p2  ORF type:complete len:102 (-),score=10.67 GHVU01176165.1:1203-1508(-)